ncbi:MAG: AI-2E family transporter [Geminicoccaceae bacterium]
MATSPPPSSWRQAVTRNPAATSISPTAMMAGIALVVAALYLGSEILIPLALAILLSFMLAPIVIRLRRWHLGRIPSVLVVVLLVFIGLLGLGSIVATQIVDLAENLPRYEWNLRTKIRDLRIAVPSGGVIERTSDMLRDLGQELEEATAPEKSEAASGREGQSGGKAESGGEAASGREAPAPEPVLVQVREPAPSPLQTLEEVAGPLVAPIATAGLVLVFVIFMLLQREDLRDRVLRLVGASDVARTTEAMDDAAKRISRYLLMQLVINVLYGIPVGVGLYFIGVPNPILWGLLATILRFIPYVGPVIAAVGPIALSFAVAPGWTLPLLTIALFVVLELFSNNVLEPWLYGSSTGLSPVAILVAAVFWTTLWGPVGLLLSTPLTVCLVVLGRHVPQLGFFDVLLGDEPALAPEVRFYQRLLAKDPEEAEELAEAYLEEESLDKLYDAVVMPALGFAEQDRLRGNLDRAAVQEIAEDTIGLVDDLAEEHLGDERAEGDTADAPSRDTTVLCIGARNGLDEAAAAMLAQLLTTRGVGAKILPREVVSGKNMTRLHGEDMTMICLSYVNPAATQHAHRIVRRLRQHLGGKIRIMVGLWTANHSSEDRQELLEATGADLVATSLWQAVRQIEEGIEPERTPATPSAA